MIFLCLRVGPRACLGKARAYHINKYQQWMNYCYGSMSYGFGGVMGLNLIGIGKVG